MRKRALTKAPRSPFTAKVKNPKIQYYASETTGLVWLSFAKDEATRFAQRVLRIAEKLHDQKVLRSGLLLPPSRGRDYPKFTSALCTSKEAYLIRIEPA
jgi:hypothetical protein